MATSSPSTTATSPTSPCEAGARRLLLIEGIPGAGKSTAARTLCEHGLAAGWTDELARPHPLTAPARPGEPGERAERWVGRCERLSAVAVGGLHVLDAAFLQGLVRFPWSEGVDTPECEALARRLLAALAPARVGLVWLAPNDPEAYLRGFVLPHRGAEWERRLARYAASTELGRRHGWRGRDGLVAFWLAYHRACEALLERLPVPVLRVPIGPDRRRDVAPAVAAWLAAGAAR